MDIEFLFANTNLTQAQIGEQLGLTQKQVSKQAKKLFSAEFRKSRKVKNYHASKLGDKNPMFNKLREEHHNYVGSVSDNKGYWMRLKPEWYTGRKNSKHVFEHHIVVCENLKITEIPRGWNVHHCDHNPQNNRFENLVLLTMQDHQKLHKAVLKGVTTISKESTLKWVEAHGTPWKREDIVSSVWGHTAADCEQDLTPLAEDK